MGLPVRIVLVAMLVVAMFAAGAATASAVIVHLANGRTLSYQPLRGTARPSGAIRPFDAFFKNLDYNGGPVMTSNTNYAVYWQPSGAPAYPPDYQAGVNQYLTDLAHDSGGTENVDSVSAQYNDAGGGFANYSSHFGGALIDTHPYPTNGCIEATICLTDQQIRTELNRYVTEQGLPRDLAHEYFLLTPPTVEDCFLASGLECSAGSEKPVYCAYHGNEAVGGEGELIYSNDPYVTGNARCDDGKHPNGTSADGVLQGGLSHEHNESITDPEPNNAWTDFASGKSTENGDKCRTPTEATEFGTPLGTAPNGFPYNQVINGHLYWYQQEWSNQGHQCLQRLTFSGAEPTATFTSAPGAGNEMTLNATASTAPGGVAQYSWQFNDGSAPEETTTPSVTHTFPGPGPYTVALTVFAGDGTSIGSAGIIVTGDEGPTATFSLTTATPTAGQPVSFDGSGSADPDGSIPTYSWNFGDGSHAGTGAAPSHTYAAVGTYTVTLIVEDSSGQVATISHPVVVDEAPTASFSMTTAAPIAGQVVSFDGSASNEPDGSIASYAWNFGDGAAGSGATPSHAYGAPGTYTVTLTITDSGGATNAVSHQITVTAAPGGSITGTSSAGSAAVVILPNSTFVALGKATVNAKTGAVTFRVSVRDPGTMSWILTFRNGRFGVFSAKNAHCKTAQVKLKGKCRPSAIVFGRGSRTVAAPGIVTFTVKPSASAMQALKNALHKKRGLPVTATLSFQSSRGGRPVSHTQSLTVKLKKK